MAAGRSCSNGPATSSSTVTSTTSRSTIRRLDRWFNTDAGFEKDPAKVPANFQKRTFPFRIDGVRAPSLNHLNMNVGAYGQAAGAARRCNSASTR